MFRILTDLEAFRRWRDAVEGDVKGRGLGGEGIEHVLGEVGRKVLSWYVVIVIVVPAWLAADNDAVAGGVYPAFCGEGLFWRELGPPEQVGGGSRRCSPKGRPVVAKVNPERRTGGRRSREHQPVGRCRCSARRRDGDEGREQGRQRVPVVEVMLAEQGKVWEEALRRWSAMVGGGGRLGSTW